MLDGLHHDPGPVELGHARRIVAGYEWAGYPERFHFHYPDKPLCYDAGMQAEALAWLDRRLAGEPASD